jgi:hydroxymethylglutaryl-CoA lyase
MYGHSASLPPLLAASARRLATRTSLRSRCTPFTVSTTAQTKHYGLYSISAARTTGNADVHIVEVGPRDGVQNIKQQISTDTKIELIRRLADTGLQTVETTSFVSPKWVPQLADGAAVMDAVRPLSIETRPLGLPVLAPNLKGLKNAHKAQAKEIVVFASVTEPFSNANQNCTIDEALAQAEMVARRACELGIRVRGLVEGH